MFTWLIYLLIGLALILLFIALGLVAIYFVIRGIISKNGGNITENTAKPIAEKLAKLNFIVQLILKPFKLKSLAKRPSANKVKFRVGAIAVTTVSVCLLNACLIYLIISLCVSIQHLDDGMVSFLMNHMLTQDDDCKCYAKCINQTRDTDEESSIDGKCAYELLFGKTEYEKFLDAFAFEYDDITKIQEFHNSKDAAGLSTFLCEHITPEAVQCYKDIVTTSDNFRSKDGFNRKNMADEELKEDLLKLLKDVKVNGRNPDCECCQESDGISLGLICLGEDHYVPGFSWEDIWGKDDPGDDPGEPKTNMGKATGQYAVTLDDGSYYWYHQDGGHGCGCVHCGNWSSAQWGGAGQSKHAFGSDGCAIYSLAIGISNLYGAEITPAVIFQDLGCGINNGEITTNSSYFDGRAIYFDTVAQALGSKYGLVTSSISTSKSNTEILNFIDDIMSKGGIVWGYWVDSKCDWCGNGDKHFMCIRKSDTDSYYCFTSCRGKCTKLSSKDGAIATMNYPLDKLECIEALVDAKPLYGFVNPSNNSGGGGNLGDGLQQDPMVFFDSCSISKGNPVKELGSTGVYLYDGLPWDSTGAYTLNSVKANEYTSKYLGTSIRSSKATDNNCSNSGIMYDGVMCMDFASPPILAFRPINNAGSPDGWGVSTRPKKVCAILKDASGTIYYLPLTCVGDAKGHTWPGGLAQTFLSTSGHTPGHWRFNSDGGTIKGPIIDVDINNLNEIKNGYSSVTYSGSKVSVQLNLEVNSSMKNLISNYSLEGFITWK